MSGDSMWRCSREVGGEETVPVNIFLTLAGSAVDDSFLCPYCMPGAVRGFAYIISCLPWKNTEEKECESKRLDDLSKVTELIRDKDRLSCQVPWPQISCSFQCTMLPPKGLRVLIISNLDKSGWPDYGHLTVSNLSHRLPNWLGSKESACNAGDAGDMGSIPGSERSPGGGHDNPL